MTVAKATQILNVALTMGIFMLPCLSYAEGLSLVRTVYLEPGYVPDPYAMARTHDGGYIVAGTYGDGWAIKTDAEGNLKWRYTTSRRDKPAYGQISSNQHPNYSSVVIMPDDSVFLCGFMPGIKTESGLLTHLDKDGKVLSEQLLDPHGFSARGFSACMAWSGGVVVVGDTSTSKAVQPTPSHPLPSDTEEFYWIIAFDATGKVRWEKRLPTAKNIGVGNQIGPLLNVTGGGFVFAASSNGVGTEVVHIGPDGKVDGRRQLDLHEGFIIVQPTAADTTLQLISMRTKLLTLITLDSSLREVDRKTQFHEPGVAYMAYRLPDESLALFGFKIHRNVYYARAMRLDPTLRRVETLDLAPNRESYWTKVGIPTGNKGEFVCARGAMTPPKPGERFCQRTSTGVICDEEKMKRSYRGVALDFIKIN